MFQLIPAIFFTIRGRFVEYISKNNHTIGGHLVECASKNNRTIRGHFMSVLAKIIMH